jgi:hypothetical protein
MIFRMDGAQLDALEEDTAKIVLVSTNWAGNRADAVPGAGDLRVVSTAIERLSVEWLGYPPFVFTVATTEKPCG